MLGDEIGKGAYGRVYKGLDLENGDFVAIKQVSLENIPPEDLASIMVGGHTLIAGPSSPSCHQILFVGLQGIDHLQEKINQEVYRSIPRLFQLQGCCV